VLLLGLYKSNINLYFGHNDSIVSIKIKVLFFPSILFYAPSPSMLYLAGNIIRVLVLTLEDLGHTYLFSWYS